MRILFINPSGGYLHEYPPLGMLSIAAYLREKGHTVSFFDEGSFIRDTKDKIIELVDNFNPQVFAFSLYTTNLNHTFSTLTYLKNRYPSVIIVVGGPHATALPQRTLMECPAIDFLVCGEGEITMLELIDALENGSDPTKINGIYYRLRNDILNTAPRKLIENLDNIPFPAYDLSVNFTYQFDPIRKGDKIATIMSSRGCSYNCTFCSKSVFGNTYRKRSPKNVVAEIRYQRDCFGISEVYFMDDLFSIDRNWLDTFYEELEKNNIRMPWKCLGRVKGLDYPDYLKMKQHGCYVIQFGVESGNDEILKNINKNITKVECVNAFKRAHKAGLNTYGFFIFGHRDDTAETIKETLLFAKQLNPDFVAFFTLVPFPGTEVYNFVEEDLKFQWHRMRYAWYGHKKSLPISISGVSAEELIEFEAAASYEFYARMRYFWKNILFSKTELKIKIIKLNFFIFHALRKIRHFIRGDLIFHINGKTKNKFSCSL